MQLEKRLENCDVIPSKVTLPLGDGWTPILIGVKFHGSIAEDIPSPAAVGLQCQQGKCPRCPTTGGEMFRKRGEMSEGEVFRGGNVLFPIRVP